MSSLFKFFNPSSVAIIGASHKKGKVGYETLTNLVKGSFKGKIFPINPKGGRILEKKVFKSLFEIKEKIDLVIIIVPAKICPEILEEIGKKEIKQAIIISAGFRETSSRGREFEERLKRIAEKYKISLLGPNCLGLINPFQNLNASFGPSFPQRGNISFISQSGAILCGFLDQAKKNRLGFSKIVSLGNKIDLSENEFLEFALKDSRTRVVLLYLESFKNGRKTIEILQNNPDKPVILLKGGISQRAKKAVSSHTGNLAGSNQALKAFLKKTEIIEAESLKDLIDLAKTFSFQKFSFDQKNKIAILTNAGGLGVLGTDVLADTVLSKIELGELSKETRRFLEKNLPEACSLENPIDIIGDARADRYKITLEALLKDKNISGIAVFLTPQKVTEAEKTAKVIVSLFKKYKKPILSCFFGQEKVKRAIEILEKNKIPNFDSPERTIEIAQKIFKKKQVEKIHPSCLTSSQIKGIEKILKKTKKNKQLEIEKTVEILKILKIPYPKFALASSEKETIIKAKQIGYPLVLKTVSQKVIHKKDIEGVKLNIQNQKELEKAYQEIVENTKDKKVIIQKMIEQGQEIIIGMKRDQQFGPLIMFGLGGVFVEVLKDVSFGLAPLTRNEAKEMVSSIKGYKILKGIRGEKEKDIDLIIDILLKISQLSFSFSQIKEIDLNPIKIFEHSGACLDFKFML